jgi:hypothetical protein
MRELRASKKPAILLSRSDSPFVDLLLNIMAFEPRNRRRKRPKWLRLASIYRYLHAIAILGFVVWFFSFVLQKIRSDIQMTKANRVINVRKTQHEGPLHLRLLPVANAKDNAMGIM